MKVTIALKHLTKKKNNIHEIFSGAVISGSRMDLSNSEFKPSKHRTNNAFALPTSLNNELSSLHLSSCNHNHEMNTNLSEQVLPLSTTSQPTHGSTYQAIEAAYLEHGIRIHLNSSTAAAVTQQQTLTTENLTGGRSTNSIQRHKAFVNRYPSRSSSALHYPTSVHDTNQDSRPFSVLQQTSTLDFEPTNMHNVSYSQPIESQNQLQLPQQLNNNYCSSSYLTSEQSDHLTLPTQLAITNEITSTGTLVNNDPDLAYMSSLLQTTTGDLFRGKLMK